MAIPTELPGPCLLDLTNYKSMVESSAMEYNNLNNLFLYMTWEVNVILIWKIKGIGDMGDIRRQDDNIQFKINLKKLVF